MEYSLSGAAKATGSSKSLIHRMCEDGRLSHRKMANGQYRIDPSELGRAFSGKNPVAVPEPLSSATEPPGKKGGTELATVRAELAVVQMKAQMLEDQLGRERETVEDLRKRLDQEQEERRNLQRQLAPPLQPAPQPARESLAVIEELHRRLEASEARNQALTGSSPPTPEEVEEPLGMVVDFHKRRREAQALVEALEEPPTPPEVKERPSKTPAGVTPVGVVRSFLGRLLGR